MKICNNFGILFLPVVMTACGTHKLDSGLLLEPTVQNILNQSGLTGFGKKNTGNAEFKNKMNWPFVSLEINNRLENEKLQFNFDISPSIVELFDNVEAKEGVELEGLSAIMTIVLIEAPSIWQKYGKNLVITSALEGKHCKDSLHYSGFALDLRNRDISIKDREDVKKELSSVLGRDFTVLLESDHYHVEYDPIFTVPDTNPSFKPPVVAGNSFFQF